MQQQQQQQKQHTQNENETMFAGMFTILNGYLIIVLNNFAHKICHNILCASITTCVGKSRA